MKRERRAELTSKTLRYLADHMEAVISLDCGLWDDVRVTDEEDFVVALTKREARKIRARAPRKP